MFTAFLLIIRPFGDPYECNFYRVIFVNHRENCAGNQRDVHALMANRGICTCMTNICAAGRVVLLWWRRQTIFMGR